MGNEIVKYHNDMNSVSFRRLNAVELDLFFTICSKIRDEGLKEITYSFEELRELSKYSYTLVEKMATDLDNTYSKMIELNFRIGNERKWTRFVLFTKYVVDLDAQTVTISVNREFNYVLNEITSNFTRFELAEFTDLKSTYSKTMYRLLKQYKSTGYYKVHIDEFKRLLDVPDSYPMYNIDKRVLQPIIKELSNHFKRLTIIKEKAKKGNKIEYIVFTFDKERAVKKQATIEYEKESTDITPQEIDDLLIEIKKR